MGDPTVSTTGDAGDALVGDGELATLAKALGNPVRVQIVRLLAARGGCACGEVVAELPLAQATVSQHLKVLKDAGLLSLPADRARTGYCLQPDALERLAAAVDELRAGASTCPPTPITTKDAP